MALLIEEEDGNHNRLDAFMRATLEFQQRALYRSDHKDENVAVMYQEARLGHIAEFVNYRKGLGFPETLSPAPAPRAGQAGGVAGPEDRGGRYDQAYLERKMQADDLRNAKSFLQNEVLSATTLDKFKEWKEDIIKATRSVDLYGQAHWSVINRLIRTRMEYSIYQVVADLFPQDPGAMAELNPETLLVQIEARLITEDQMEYKRLQFEVAKQK